jgi:hypothetical protein
MIDEDEDGPENEVRVYKIGQSKGRPRIWLDGKAVASSGFLPGTHYWLQEWSSNMKGMYFECGLDLISESVLNRDSIQRCLDTGCQRRKVSGRPSGRPIINIAGSILDSIVEVEGATHVEVEFGQGTIMIKPAEYAE